MAEIEYDSIGSSYLDWKLNTCDVRQYIADYTIMKCLPRPFFHENDLLDGKRILDLGCGTGYYARRFKQLNCSYVLGVDVSTSMLNAAREEEKQSPMNIEYICADAKSLFVSEEPFDLVIGIYLLTNARTREELVQMVLTIYNQLRRGGGFIGTITNSINGTALFEKDRFRKYGATIHVDKTVEENSIPDGTPIKIDMFNSDDNKIGEICDFHWSASTYETVFQEVGFTSFEWIPFQLDPVAVDHVFCEEFLSFPTGIGIRATK